MIHFKIYLNKLKVITEKDSLLFHISTDIVRKNSHQLIQ